MHINLSIIEWGLVSCRLEKELELLENGDVALSKENSIDEKLKEKEVRVPWWRLSSDKVPVLLCLFGDYVTH